MRAIHHSFSLDFFLIFPFNNHPKCPLYHPLPLNKKSQHLLIFKPTLSPPTQIPIRFAFISFPILLILVLRAVCIRDLQNVCLWLNIRSSQHHPAQCHGSSPSHPPPGSGWHASFVTSFCRYNHSYVQRPRPWLKFYVSGITLDLLQFCPLHIFQSLSLNLSIPSQLMGP